jgi:hypothetical protein
MVSYLRLIVDLAFFCFILIELEIGFFVERTIGWALFMTETEITQF